MSERAGDRRPPGGWEPEIGKPLPGATRAMVREGKLSRYLLDPQGADPSKADWLDKALGYRRQDWRLLQSVLLDGAVDAIVTRVWREAHGVQVNTCLAIIGANEHADRTIDATVAWIYRSGGDGPSLVTLIPGRYPAD